MTIPAAFTRDPVTLHATETHVEIFEATRPYVVHAWSAVGRGWTLVEAPHRPVSTQFIDSCDEAQFFPSRQCSLLQSGRSEVRGNIWKRHCRIVPVGDTSERWRWLRRKRSRPRRRRKARRLVLRSSRVGSAPYGGRQLEQTTEPSLVWPRKVTRSILRPGPEHASIRVDLTVQIPQYFVGGAH